MNVPADGSGNPGNTDVGVNVLPGRISMMWPSASATWILPEKVPFMMMSSCASVRFVASLLTTTQKFPVI